MRMGQTTRQRLRCGRHSNIPVCCIAWYVTAWRVLFRCERFKCWKTTNGIMHEWHRYHEWRQHPDAEYVECPLCKLRRRRPAAILRCRCSEARQ